METAKRNGVVDLMRFVFCMIIVIYHSRNLGGNTVNNTLFADAGYICVEFFFLVSGFLMAKSAMTMQDASQGIGVETVKFLWRKIRPVIPFYLLAVFFSYSRQIFANDFSFIETVENFMMGIWDLTFLRVSGIKTFGLIRATWYLSAMYLAMLILFPMLRKWKKNFIYIIAPLLSIFLMGYLSQTCDNLNQYINNWNLVFPGMIRAIAELSLGCICYAVCEKIKSLRFTTFSRILITFVQVAGYGLTILCMHLLPCKQFDFVLVAILAVCVTLSFSGQGIAASFFTGRVYPWLGKMSLIIYLNHMWIKDSLASLLPASLGYWTLLGICIVCVVAVSLCSLFFVNFVEKLFAKHGAKIRRCFLKEG